MNTAAFLPPKGKKLPLRLRLIRNVRPIAVPTVLGLNLFSYGAVFMAASQRLPKDIKTGLLAPYNCWHNRIATLKFVQDIPLVPTDPSYGIVDDVDQNLYKLADIPMLICWGKRDFVFDNTYLIEWRRRFPSASIHVFADAGHYVLVDAGDKISVLVKEFLKQHPL
jgi:haloalkane dehalogenase